MVYTCRRADKFSCGDRLGHRKREIQRYACDSSDTSSSDVPKESLWQRGCHARAIRDAVQLLSFLKLHLSRRDAVEEAVESCRHFVVSVCTSDIAAYARWKQLVSLLSGSFEFRVFVLSVFLMPRCGRAQIRISVRLANSKPVYANACMNTSIARTNRRQLASSVSSSYLQIRYGSKRKAERRTSRHRPMKSDFSTVCMATQSRAPRMCLPECLRLVWGHMASTSVDMFSRSRQH